MGTWKAVLNWKDRQAIADRRNKMIHIIIGLILMGIGLSLLIRRETPFIIVIISSSLLAFGSYIYYKGWPTRNVTVNICPEYENQIDEHKGEQ